MTSSRPVTSQAIVPYKPCQTTDEFIRSELDKREHVAYRRSFECASYDATHLRNFGKGRIIVLLGTPSAGKTSIIKQLTRELPKCIGTGMDEYTAGEYYPSQLADLIQKHLPELYVKMSKAMKHSDIARAVFDFDDSVHWKENLPKEVLREARLALAETKRKKDSIPQIPFEEIQRKMMDDVIEYSSNGTIVIFDDFCDSTVFLKHIITKNFFAPLKVGLAYCPFHILAERVKIRNVKVSESGNLDDERLPLGPLLKFLDLYKPAEDGDTAIDILHRKEIEAAFESAFNQEVMLWKKRFSFDSEARKNYSELTAQKDELKNEIMTTLGFSLSEIEEVKITPRFKRIDYLFNSHVMKPSESTKIIRDWR